MVRVTFEEFLDGELDGLVRYAQMIAGNRQDAHDVLTGSLVNAWERWGRISRAGSPLAYVRRMVTNAFLTEQRSWNRRMVTLTDPVRLVDMTTSKNEPGRVDDRSQLHGLLLALPRRQRTAVVLRFYYGMTVDESAEILSCSPSAVRNYVSIALRSLRVTAREAEQISGDITVRKGTS